MRNRTKQQKIDAKLRKQVVLYNEINDDQCKPTQRLTYTELTKLAEMYGGVGNNQGKVAEEFYYNPLKHNTKLNEIQFDFIEKNVTCSKAGIEEQYDLLLVNGKDVLIIEVKYRLPPQDIDRLVGRKRTNFITLFPEYKNYTLH